ncbi:MAG: chromosome partitioning protein ParB, partial [Rectinemataceae bacterium]|nr:chromosome partitioning protein ParB [Rectinemataceae bacterium]
LKLSPRMLDSLRLSGISAGHARALLSLPDAPVRDKLFERIIAEFLSVRQTEDAAQTIIAAASEGGRAAKAAKAAKKAAAASAAAGSRDPDLVAVEQKLIQSLGTKVSIKGTAKKGIVEVEYYSLEDLDRIIDVLGK